MGDRSLIQVSEAAATVRRDVLAAGKSGPVTHLSAAETTKSRGPVCIVDDDVWVCDSLSELLETYGFSVLAYVSSTEFLGDEQRRDAKCLVVDQHMPALGGLDLIAALRHDGDCPPAILITGRVDAAITARAGALNVLAILEKPFAVTRLVDLVGAAVAAGD